MAPFRQRSAVKSSDGPPGGDCVPRLHPFPDHGVPLARGLSRTSRQMRHDPMPRNGDDGQSCGSVNLNQLSYSNLESRACPVEELDAQTVELQTPPMPFNCGCPQHCHCARSSTRNLTFEDFPCHVAHPVKVDMRCIARKTCFS